MERIVLSNLTYITSIVDLIVVSVETLRINGGRYLDKEFTKLIRMNI